MAEAALAAEREKFSAVLEVLIDLPADADLAAAMHLIGKALIGPYEISSASKDIATF